MNRKYELKERARRQSQTRQRIVEAAVELHTSVGPARTTISGIAERAGVERHTVYAHFPDEPRCSGPAPSTGRSSIRCRTSATLAEIDDPMRRLRRALGEMYAWYDSVEADLALFVRDASVVPRRRSPTERTSQLGDVDRRVSLGWPRRKSVRAAIGHALEFETWRSLVRRQGLSRAQAVDAMTRLVSSV